MKLDLYTKSVLTVIAVALCAIAFQYVKVVSDAEAQILWESSDTVIAKAKNERDMIEELWAGQPITKRRSIMSSSSKRPPSALTSDVLLLSAAVQS